MASIREPFIVAVQHHQAGRLQAAEQICLQILATEPTNADALHLLGAIKAQTGNHQMAVEYIERAVALRPDWAEAHANLGNVLTAQGRLSEAVACYRRAVELKPDFARARYNLGVVLSDLGKPDEALACYRRALELEPNFAEAHNNLGNALKSQGSPGEAVACYQRALELKPDYAAAHNNLGTALYDLGKPDEALACYRRAIQLKPDFALAHNNLGIALGNLGDLDEAVTCYRRALALEPNFALAHYNLGNALQDRGDLREAVACYRRALELEPDHAEVHSNLGNALKNQGDLEGAVACYRRALELKPDQAAAHNNLGNAFRDQGMLDLALACYRRALELKPDDATAHSNLLYTLHYCTGVTATALAEAHAEYDRRHAVRFGSAALRNEKIHDLHGRVRLGFVSRDLGRHPVGYFLVRVLENLDRKRHETICYSDRVKKDGLTRRIQTAATGWRDVMGMNDERLAEQIRADRIDILFDLAGHTACNRLLVFARKPAAIQISWIGYEGTTGLGAMDYLLADHLMVPPGSERHYCETVLRMPDGYLCYDPPETAPPAGPPPFLNNGFATFGSFNNLAKITPEVVTVWARILRAAPTARLLMKYRGLGDRSVKQRFLDLFAVHDVGPERLDLGPWSSYSDYLATYREVDLTLDPFPFSGSATTCESLWMGVPVITCAGETFASRHSLCHLTNSGLTETIARDRDAYVELAVALAGDPARILALRSGSRERMAASPLCDGKRFARNLALLLDAL
jgi:protein O-GlcNAc transferase